MQQLLPWYELNGDVLQFKSDSEDYSAARQAALICQKFMPDDEDEQTDDISLSCFNCMKRRWIANGLECIQLRVKS